MLQLLRLLLYLAAGAVLCVPSARSIYYESAPSCGYAATGFVHFEQSRELLLEPKLGVCGWGFDKIDLLKPRVKSCVSCSFTPADEPVCQKGATVVTEPEWYLAVHQECRWQGCWLGGEACNGTVESTALCEDGSLSLNCCPFKRYVRCCTSVDCVARSSPAGQCVLGEKDLLPGQQFVEPLFAVSAASTDCSQYRFETLRVCQSDRTLAAEQGYRKCDTEETVSRDSEGCVKLRGYTFHQGVQIRDADNWRVDDGTPWNKLVNPAAAQQAAARDMVLMASRCSALDTCAGFQNTGTSPDLLYQLPMSNNWVSVQQAADTRCYGIYEKTPPPSSCPRLSGYLFIPLRTLDTSVSSGFTPAWGAGPCSTCSSSSALAAQCDDSSTCVGFSNYHGLFNRAIASSSSNSGPLSDAPMTQFSTTPCAGTYVRVANAFPTEVEQLDRLLCGERVYCSTTQLRYQASYQSSASGVSYVDLTVDILSDMTVPRGMLDVTGGGLQPIPSIRSLTLRCHNGSALQGGIPVGLAALTPLLQELRVQGCRTAGSLPEALVQLRYLRVLDLGNNALSGSLPAAWGKMTLGYLNLSLNQLTGTLPTAWRGIITAQGVSAPPSPPAVAASPPPAVPTASGRRRRATAASPQSALLVADLSVNSLVGPVDRQYVYDCCVRNDLRMQLKGDLSVSFASGVSLPTFLLLYNPGIADWAGSYSVADLNSGSSGNLCGAYQYKIALGVLWGVFGLCLLAIITWSAARALKATRAARRGRFFIADVGGPSPGEAAAADADSAGRGCPAVTAGCASSMTGAIAGLWGKRWVRRVTLLLRISYLAADVALDIRVIVWLFVDGDITSAGVCLAFLLVAQVVISTALLASLAHHFFTSTLLIAVLSPLLLAMGPVVGPVLAVANIRNSDVPLVFWRYLELVEFCVALLQAPAESVTQSIVYARYNRLGNGMYMDHGLFLASIILSLGDMLIAAIKLCRYKRGPLRRILVAVTYLDRVRDPVDYRKPLLSADVDGSPDVGGADDHYVPHYVDTPLNPTAGGGRRSPDVSRSQHPREDAGPLPISPPGGGNGSEAATPVLELSPAQGLDDRREPPAPQGAETALADNGGMAAAAAAAAHTFTPLTAPRYRPSLLAASSQRLGAGGAHSKGQLSRLGPGGSSRGASLVVSSQPPLRPLGAALPVTPTAASRSGPRPPSEDPFSSGQTRAWDAAEAEAAQSEWGGPASTSGGAGGGDGSLSRQSRSVPEGLPAPPFASHHPLAGSISADVYGSVATGGHGPPPIGDSASAPEAQGMSRTTSGSGARGPSQAASSSSAATAAAAAAAAIAALPPPSPSAYDDPRFVPSAAAAAKAALAGALGAPPPLQRSASPASAPPERLVLGNLGGSGGPSHAGQMSEITALGAGVSPSARSLRHVSSIASSSRSAQGSPARRREGPALSIAVPASPVQGQGIEVIRISTPSSSRHLSPQTSRGAPTPVGMLPQPPQQLQLLLQRERVERQAQAQQDQQVVQPQRQQSRSEEQETEQPSGSTAPLPSQPPGG